MTDEPFDDETPLDDDLTALLADPAMWEAPDADLEDAIVAAIAAEAPAPGAPSSDAVSSDAVSSDAVSSNVVSSNVVSSNVVSLADRRRVVPFLAGAAAALVLVLGSIALFGGDTESTPEVALTLEATELAPGASGTAEIDTTPLGTRIIIDVAGLPPAPEGQYYEAWLRTGPEVGVSAGTFHLRGGDGEIELWAGVKIADYPLFTITVQDEGDPASSGQVVLRGRAG